MGCRNHWRLACIAVLPLLIVGCATVTRPDGSKVRIHPPYELRTDGTIAPNERCWQIAVDAAVKAGPEVVKAGMDAAVKAAQVPAP